MTDAQFRAFLDLMMCSDPWPVEPDDMGTHDHMICLADMESAKRGYGDWIEAYHDFVPES